MSSLKINENIYIIAEIVKISLIKMSILEIVMLICFGAAWPFSIRRAILSKSVEGKSLVFLVIIWFGYLAGILHKLF